MKTLYFISFCLLFAGCIVEPPRTRVIEERPVIVEPRHEPRPLVEVRPGEIIVTPHHEHEYHL